tara:strand:+ start:2766 stop:2888 length:123 start_codon:yes stop_codon:yes gene_type:complete
MKLTDFVNSEKGKNLKLVLDLAIAILLFFWLLKNHKIIKK